MRWPLLLASLGNESKLPEFCTGLVYLARLRASTSPAPPLAVELPRDDVGGQRRLGRATCQGRAEGMLLHVASAHRVVGEQQQRPSTGRQDLRANVRIDVAIFPL